MDELYSSSYYNHVVYEKIRGKQQLPSRYAFYITETVSSIQMNRNMCIFILLSFEKVQVLFIYNS